MPTVPSAARRRHLGLGAALLASSFAAAASAGGIPPMQWTSVNSFSGTMSGTNTYGTTNFSPSFAGPAQNSFTYQTTDTSVRMTDRKAICSYMSGMDFVMFVITPNSANVGPQMLTSGSGSGTVSLTFSTGVLFTNIGALDTAISSIWKYNGNVINDNQAFSAGTYSFTWEYTVNSATNTAGVVAGFTAGGGVGGGVPLPGAAGLAACGLLAASRRRRR